MRSRLTALLSVGFIFACTGGALALGGGAVLAPAGGGGASASFSQYRECENGNSQGGSGCQGNQGQGNQGQGNQGQQGQGGQRAQTPPVQTPPASTFIPQAATAKVSSRGVATVRCATACHIVLRARRGSHRVLDRLTLRAQGTGTVRLSKRDLARLGRGKVLVTIEVDGKVIATQTLRLR